MQSLARTQSGGEVLRDNRHQTKARGRALVPQACSAARSKRGAPTARRLSALRSPDEKDLAWCAAAAHPESARAARNDAQRRIARAAWARRHTAPRASNRHDRNASVCVQPRNQPEPFWFESSAALGTSLPFRSLGAHLAASGELGCRAFRQAIGPPGASRETAPRGQRGARGGTHAPHGARRSDRGVATDAAPGVQRRLHAAKPALRRPCARRSAATGERSGEVVPSPGREALQGARRAGEGEGRGAAQCAAPRDRVEPAGPRVREAGSCLPGRREGASGLVHGTAQVPYHRVIGLTSRVPLGRHLDPANKADPRRGAWGRQVAPGSATGRAPRAARPRARPPARPRGSAASRTRATSASRPSDASQRPRRSPSAAPAPCSRPETPPRERRGGAGSVALAGPSRTWRDPPRRRRA